MIHKKYHLKDIYPFLGDNGCDPVVTTYINDADEKWASSLTPRPAMLILPGGGYGNVSPREAEPVAINFQRFGYNVFVLTYSTKPHHYPTAIREVAGAMELIYATAGEWNTDISRVAIMGFSAGGHLACHYSNSYASPEVRQVFPDSKPVQAAVLAYPVISGDPAHRHNGSFVNLSGHAVPTEEDIEKFSLQNLVTENTPPTFLWHTRTDNLVPVINSLLYAQALALKDVPFSLHVYPFGKHGLSTVDAYTCVDLDQNSVPAHDWIEDCHTWLTMTL